MKSSKQNVIVPAPATGKLNNRDELVLDNLSLVKAIAIRVHENLPVHVDVDDLIHAGILGLFDAANKYDSRKNVAFPSYAKHRIKGAIIDSLRAQDWASRDIRRRQKDVEAATRDLATTLQRDPTELEIAAKLGVTVVRWRQISLDLACARSAPVSTSSHEFNQQIMPPLDIPSGPETRPDWMCGREELRDTLGEAVKILPERYQKVVVLYYTKDLTMKEIGNVMGINESRVSQIHKSALQKLAVRLQSDGIESSRAFWQCE